MSKKYSTFALECYRLRRQHGSTQDTTQEQAQIRSVKNLLKFAMRICQNGVL